MKPSKWFARPAPDAASTVAEQVDVARRLVGISDQKLLNDPYTNPATRSDADRLRITQHREQLRLNHRRHLRRERVSDARAAAAEKALEAITAAREAVSPGRAVADLTRTRSRALVGCLVLSVLLSIGSGVAIEFWLQNRPMPQPPRLGYLIEGGLTILATTMIVLRGRLAARNTALQPWQVWAFGVLIVVPLAVSAVLATLGSIVGAVCSLGAAAWSVAAYLAATSLSTAINDALDEVNDADETELRTIALGESEPAPATGHPHPADVWVSEQTCELADQIEAFLSEQDGPDTGGVSGGHIDPTPRGPNPYQAGCPTREEVLAAWERQQAHNAARKGSQIEPDQHEHRGDLTAQISDVNRAPESATKARREAGAHTRQRIVDHTSAHPDHSVPEIAEALDLSPSTIRRHLRTLRGSDG